MQVELTEQFLKDFAGLQPGLRRKCEELLKLLTHRPATELKEWARHDAGWRLHALRDSPFTSFSLDLKYRVLVKLDGETAYIHRAVKHALADDPKVNRRATAPTPYEVNTSIIGPQDVYDALVALGVSNADAAGFQGVRTEDALQEVLEHCDASIAGLALELYETTGVISERTRYRVYSKDLELESALEGDLREWHLYLHPTQRFIVDFPAAVRVAIMGSAGTGKTVCAWHRVRALADKGISVALVCPDDHALAVSKSVLEQLLRNVAGRTYYFVPHSAEQLVELSEAVDHLVFDEGQELSPAWYRALSPVLQQASKGLTLFYDLNQLGGNIEAGDESRFRERYRRWEEVLGNMPHLARWELAVNYRNSYEIAKYYVDLLATALPEPVRVELPAYSTADVVRDKAGDSLGRIAKVSKHLLALRQLYLPTELAVVCCPPSVKPQVMIAELGKVGIEAHANPTGGSGILVTTPDRIRGHERKGVIVVAPTADFATAWGRAIDTYIACSRARDRLIVI